MTDHYLELYSNPSMHWTMLNDRVRTKTYYNAICHNRHLFKGKVVMDVGCGTGILSLFAAKAGARRVISIESSAIANSAKQIVIDNKMDHIITVLNNKLEDIKALPDGLDRVDILISEFMGYCLFVESMVETVLFARDKWLKPGGLIFPDRCSLYAVGFWDPIRKEQLFDTWDKFLVQVPEKNLLLNPLSHFAAHVDARDIEFNLSHIRKQRLTRPLICSISFNQCATEPALLTTLDMNTATIEDLRRLDMPFEFKTTWDGTMHGIAAYFDVQFTKCFKLEQFTTAPGATPTHWQHTLFFFDKEMKIFKSQEMRGNFVMRKNKRYERDIDIQLKIDYEGGMPDSKIEFHEVNHYKCRLC